MKKNEIISRAKKYIDLEGSDFFRNQVEQLIQKNDIDELYDRFYKDLEFGTGGLRGLIGGGYNRMNSLTVQRATQGLANYIINNIESKEFSAVITYDNRHFSDQFALEAAKVLCGNGFKTYLFTGIRSTPLLSFTIRHFGATTGINITSSHNPPEYNGYKAYWNDGCQVLPPHDSAIVSEAASVIEIKTTSREDALEKGLLVMIDKEADEPYIEMVKSLSIRPELLKKRGKELKVIYTPLHGAGAGVIPGLLSEMGISPICVEEQMKQDGSFPTVAKPNPEEPSALKMALDLAKVVKADLVLATDPDSDRLGIAVSAKNGYELLNGNQLGALLAEYIFSGLKEKGALPKKATCIKTIVTTELLRRIAEEYNVVCFDVLTGIKYIAGKIREFETGDEGYEYVFGGEESFGYLIGKEVRDKDAISASLMTAEMALHYKIQGWTLLDQLDKIYEKYGYFQEILITEVLKGESGAKIMKELMDRLRKTPPKTFAGEEITYIKDYLEGTVLDLRSGKRKKIITLPSSNVLQFILRGNSIISVRPSGTEPKIKFYASCCEEVGVPLKEAKRAVQKKIDLLKNEISSLIGG